MRYCLCFKRYLSIFAAIMCVFLSCADLTFAQETAAAADNTLLAFPGAEGGGKYSPGARGALPGGKLEVYHVTQLGDSGGGSLRDAVSKSGRIVVFDISGTIELNTDIKIGKDNITILGQTAPGDGVTISGASVLTDDGVKNIIARYLKVRPTDKNGLEVDGIGGRFGTNIIFDHISTSWCVDELLTLYGGPAQDLPADKQVGNHLTIQNTIGSESLRMSTHQKGAHGYGGIWGGTYASYLNNILAHHDSRSPRLDRQLVATEVSNNIIYDWGQTNSAYGAEPYASGKSKDGTMMTEPSNVNYTGNYYKAGPSTASKLLTRIFDVTGPYDDDPENPKTKFYFDDNYLVGTGVVSDYHNNSYINNYSGAEFLSEPVDMGGFSYQRRSAEDAYEYVLNNAGATLPRRDAADARIINDIVNGTGRLVNNAGEVGGLIPVESETKAFTIPAEWLEGKGYTGKSETDITDSGYTVIEEYVNEWTEEQSKTPPTNPDIIVQSPAISSLSGTIGGLSVDNGEWAVINEGETVKYKASAIARGGNEVTGMELYDRNTKIGAYDGAAIDDDISLAAGTHYLTCRATNTRGEKTQSTTSIVYVKKTALPGSYSFTEIRKSGYNGYKGKGGASMDDKGVYTLYGSGRLKDDSGDSCGFMYKQISGDFDVSVRLESVPKFENQQLNGIMVRAGLEPNAVMAMLGDGWMKYGENARILSRSAKGEKSREVFFTTKDGMAVDNSNDDKSKEPPKYLRIQRSGNSLTFSVSNKGTDWTDNDRQPLTIDYDSLPDTMYVGLATDSAQGVSVKEYFSVAEFSMLSINGESDVETPENDAVPFYDEDFENPLWYFNSGGGKADLSGEPVDGNSGIVGMFWGIASRDFAAQRDRVVSVSADYCSTSNSVDYRAGVRFMLNGLDSDGNSVKIKSYFAHHTKGFYEDYDGEDHTPEYDPISDAAFEIMKWYKVEMTLDYDTGKGTFSFKPYTEYDSFNKIYTAGEPLFEDTFDFDTSVAVYQLHVQRRGGSLMYLDNVAVSVDPLLSAADGQILVDRPKSGAVLRVAAYNADNTVAAFEERNIGAGEVKSFNISDFNIPDGCSAKAFIWDKNQAPLWSAVRVK